MEELATATSDTYRQADGSYEFVGYTTPVNYLADDGAWEPINSDLVPAAGDTYAVENAENDFVVRMPEDASTDPVKITTDGQWVTFEMDGLDGTPVVDGTEATYTQADGADASEIIYEARPDGVKESIVLDQPPAEPVEYTFDLALSAGLTPRLRATGEIDIVDTTGRQIFTMPAPFMTDANNTTSINVSYQLTPTATGWRLVVTPADGWLQDPARAYPVIVDPTVTKTPATDGWIAEASPTNVNAGGGYLRVGGLPGIRRRALLKFDLTGIPTDAQIQSADGTDPALLRLYLDSELTGGTAATTDLVARRVGKDDAWTPGWLTWNTRQHQTPWTTPGGVWGEASPIVTINGGTSGYKNFNVLETVQKWVNTPGTWPNNGFIVKQNTDVDKQLWFHAVDTTTTSPPKLVIKYQIPDHPPAPPTNFAVTPGGPGYLASSAPTIQGVLSDPDGGVVTGVVTVVEGSEQIWSGTTAPVASGGLASVKVPLGELKPGHTYSIRMASQSGAPAQTSPPAVTTLQNDTLAARSESQPCPTGCIPFDSPRVMFQGTLSGRTSIPTSSLPVDPLEVGRLYFALSTTASASSASVTLFADDLPVSVAPTVTTSASAARTRYVSLWPSDTDTIALTKSGADVQVTLTAVGWEPWDKNEEPELDDYEPTQAELDEYEALNEAFAEPSTVSSSTPSADELSALAARSPKLAPVTDTCFREGEYQTCIEQLSDAEYEQALASVDGDSDDPSWAGSTPWTTPAERGGFSSCPRYRDWVTLRELGCTVVKFRARYWRIRSSGAVERHGSALFRVELRIHLKVSSRAFVISPRAIMDNGTDWGEAVQLSIYMGCHRCDARDVWRPFTEETNYEDWGDVTVPQDELEFGEIWRQPIAFTFETISLVNPAANIAYASAYSPITRCDKVKYQSQPNSDRPNRGAGCVFDEEIATAYIFLPDYPKSAGLIRRAQNEYGWGDPISYRGRPLQRLQNRTKIRANRRKAQRWFCDDDYEFTCDEYPFAASYQGCKLREDLCRVADVPADQNSGTGGKVGTMFWHQRVLNGEPFYVFVYD